MASTATATHQAATPSPEALVLGALEDARAGTLALVSHLDDDQLTRVLSPIMSPLVWDLGAHRRLRGPVAGTAARRAGAAARGPRCCLRRLRDAPRGARGHRGAGTRRGPLLTCARCARASPRRFSARASATASVCEMVIRHELQHCETMRQTMALADLLPAGEPPAIEDFAAEEAPTLARRGGAMVGDPRGRLRDGRPRERLRLRQRAPPPHRRAGRVPDRAPPGQRRRVDALRRRTAAMSGASGGPTKGGRGKRSTTSPTIPRSPAATHALRRATSAGSRPMPSPARTTRVCPARRSGSGPRPRSSGRPRRRSTRGATIRRADARAPAQRAAPVRRASTRRVSSAYSQDL